MEQYSVYRDIQARTGGEIYLGVVGPVRTGKSTFIKRFMEQMVLPGITDEHQKNRTRDELPQSAAGKTIMTTEPKFVPKEAARIDLGEDTAVKVRRETGLNVIVNTLSQIFIDLLLNKVLGNNFFLFRCL